MTSEKQPPEKYGSRELADVIREVSRLCESLKADEIRDLGEALSAFSSQPHNFVGTISDLREMHNFFAHSDDGPTLRDFLKEVVAIFRKLEQKPIPTRSLFREIFKLVLKIDDALPE